MQITRRGWIGATAALAGASAAPAAWAQGGSSATAGAPIPAAPDGPFRVSSPGAGRDYTAALAALRDCARAELAAVGLPGMTLSVTDADGFTAVLALGWADIDQRVPMTPDRYFQIGSISKSFIALTVLSLADQGKIDLEAPLARYLPDVPLPAEPITVAQVLSHTSGLPDGAPFFPRTPDGRLWCGFAPGSRFSYSNTGYGLLGRLIERVFAPPFDFQAAVAVRVRRPLGLTPMRGWIEQAGRSAYAVGYWPWDRVAAASLPGARLEFASWDEEDNPAGSMGATSEQMATYLRALIAIGRGQGAPVLSDAAARRFVAPVIPADADFGPGSHYACGVAIQPVDGIPCLHHTGGMMAFSSSFHVDAAAGVASFASVNARNEGYRPRQTTAYAIRLMRAVRAGAPLPPPPDPLGPYRIKDPAPLLGTFRSEALSFVLAGDADGVTVEAWGAKGRVVPRGPDRLLTDHPRLANFGFDAVRENGRVVGYWHGGTLYGRDTPAPVAAPPERLAALAGAYLNRDPWVGGATILARGDQLWADGIGRLVERGGWWSAEKDPGGVERLRFDAMLNGKAQRLNVSGDDLWRITV
jgi:CubicO group peptidase (beta-lactamase class C family)